MMVISDDGTGVDAENLTQCFGTVGNYVASETARGRFGRGAKDVSALGDVQFTSFHKNGLSTRCNLTTDNIFTVEDTIITSAERYQGCYKEVGSTGMAVRLAVSSFSMMSSIEKVKMLPHYFSLQTEKLDLFLNSFILNDLDSHESYDLLLSFYAQQELNQTHRELLEQKLNILGHTATFKLWELSRSEVAQNESRSSEFKTSGIIIASKLGIHQKTNLNYRLEAHKHMKRVCGVFYCPGIDNLIDAFDNGDETMPIIDNNRLNGLNSHHPFTREMKQLLIKVTEHVLNILLQESVKENVGHSIPIHLDLPGIANMKGVSYTAARLKNEISKIETVAGIIKHDEIVDHARRYYKNKNCGPNISIMFSNYNEVLEADFQEPPEHSWLIDSCGNLVIDIDCRDSLIRKFNEDIVSRRISIAYIASGVIASFAIMQNQNEFLLLTKIEMLVELDHRRARKSFEYFPIVLDQIMVSDELNEF
jgi:hypothetical protein